MYYDIDDILCGEQWITIRIDKPIYKGGYLDSEYGLPDQDLQVDQKLRVPFWIAQFINQLDYCQIDIPEMFSEQFQNALQAAPLIQNLKDKSNYFYEFGVKIIEQVPNIVEKEQFKGSLKLSKVMKKVFVERSQNIIKMSQQPHVENIQNFMWQLTSFETKLFNTGREISEQYDRWRDESINRRRKPFKQKRIKQ